MIIAKINILVPFLIILSVTKGDELKGSLAFVIDNTKSMKQEIAQVKERTDDVFEAVLGSNASQVDEFIIVTFNDPETELRIITKNKEEFKRALYNIEIGGGDDCPEMAMAGVEKALQKSKPNSFIYVFTDASAKDSYIFERVKSLSQKKSIQVTFLLTGKCKKATKESYVVYDKLAAATSGQVFHVEKQEIAKIIEYILATVKNKRTILAHKSFKNGCGKKFNFTVDSKVWDILISVSSANSEFQVIGPVGATKAAVEDLIRTSNTSIVKMKPKPGNYTIDIINCGKTTVAVSASTSVSFRHGFSSTRPNSLDETFPKPISDKAHMKSYLAIELDNKDKDIKLEAIEIRHMDDNVNKILSLKLIDEKEQFYITDLFIPPNFAFKVAVNGYTDNKEKITRISPTTLEYHQSPTKNIRPKAPAVRILAKNQIIAEYDKPLTLKCKVYGFPTPVVTWADDSRTIWPSTVKRIEPPYEFLSILQIKKVTENITFTCKANNGKQDTDTVKVITKRKTFFKVLEYPTDVYKEYGTTVELKCKIEAVPPATIIWYQNNKIIHDNDDFHISSDRSILKIRNVQPKLSGKYYVEAFNDHEKRKYDFNVIVTGIEIPRINKYINSYRRSRESSVDISCRVVKGKPVPVISWSFDRNFSGKFINLKTTRQTVHIGRIDLENVGTYRCNASNKVGMDFHDMRLFIDYPPIVKIVPRRRYKARKGDRVKLYCRCDGLPIPKVRWFLGDTEIHNGIKYRIFRNHTLSFIGAFEDSGSYACEASNSLGAVRKSVSVVIYEPAKIKPSKQSVFKVKLKSTLTLPCEVDGYPRPEVKWTYYGFYSTQQPTRIRCDEYNKSIVLKDIQLVNEGFYECTARNLGTRDSITYEVYVPVAPIIKPILGTNDIHSVEGDPILKLPCSSSGSPKPTVKWLINGLNIALGTGLYEIDYDGTLIMNNLTSESKGIYTCKAENSLGNDIMNYKVNIHSYPPAPDSNSLVILLREGKTEKMYCDMPLKDGDLVRWFKDGKLIKTGHLTLVNVTKADAGQYTCRVSTSEHSYSFHKRTIVGSVPKFISEESGTVVYKDGAEARLDCRATGDSPSKTKWWHDKVKMTVKSSIYTFKMKASNIGEYMCYVTNEFGTIKRTFDITDGECLMKIENDFTARQPILVTGHRKRQWPIFEISKGFLRIKKLRKFSLCCPESFISYDGWNYGGMFETNCVGDSMFRLGKKSANLSQITCNKPVKPTVKMISEYQCFGRNTQLFYVGFDIRGSFLTVYNVCFDKVKKAVLFVKHGMHRAIADTIPKYTPEYTVSGHLNISFEQIYDCRHQQDVVSAFTSKTVSVDKGCCFARRQLVNPKDVLPGISQVATYHYLNVVPQWSTCGTENWDEVERRVRLYALGLNKTISVWTGSASVNPSIAPIYLKDKSNQHLEIPQYIWKVVEDQLAVVHINVPGLTFQQTSSFTLCKDICNTVEWMKSTQWHDLDKGFIYCCNIRDFATAFHYENLFVLV